jgi:hypothetical protein
MNMEEAHGHAHNSSSRVLRQDATALLVSEMHKMVSSVSSRDVGGGDVVLFRTHSRDYVQLNRMWQNTSLS